MEQQLLSYFHIKSLFLALDEEELREYFRKYDFIYTITQLNNICETEDFLYLSREKLDVIHNVVSHQRWNYKKSENVNLINTFLAKIIHVENENAEDYQIRNEAYLNSELFSRNIKNMNDQEIVDFVKSDFDNIQSIIYGKIVNILKNPFGMLSTMNYCITYFPEVLNDDEQMDKFEVAMILIEDEYEKIKSEKCDLSIIKNMLVNNYFKSYIKKTRKRLNSLGNDKEKVKEKK